MISPRTAVPIWVKRLFWNHKHQNTEIDQLACPQDILNLIAETLRPTDHVLDLGCGAGNLLVGLRQKGWPGSYTGVDISELAIEKDHDKYPQATWVVSPLEKFPVIRAHVICFVESLYYVRMTSLGSVLAKCKHCLVPGGRMFVRMWDTKTHADYLSELDLQGFKRNVRYPHISVFTSPGSPEPGQPI